mmetsp:Transcript_41072/g.76399  ORF Transcript_41072/g.76399 Transcript_41072/m.76399 type:complete len:432 (+) Transcript_41072:72-1367(+)
MYHDFLSLPSGACAELCKQGHCSLLEDKVAKVVYTRPLEPQDDWEPLDPMTAHDVYAEPESCIRHLEQHGCGLVRGVLDPKTCQQLQRFVDAELERVLQLLSADPENRAEIERQRFGTVRDRQQRWDLKLPLVEPVKLAICETVQALSPLLFGTVESEGALVELSCLITDPGAPRQNVHVDTGGWKTACAPLLTVFVALQETTPEMGPTLLFPGTHDDPFLQQWLSILPGADRSPEQFGGGLSAHCAAGSAILMNSRLLHCGGTNLPEKQGGSRRRFFYLTWQKPHNTNHGSTYTLMEELVGRYRVADFLSQTCKRCHDEERIALEIVAKRKDDPQKMLEFAMCLREEGDPGAVEWFRATGRKGHPLACMHLAEMYCLGELGLETNYEAAEELRKFGLGIFDHLADKSESKPTFQSFLDDHAAIFRQDLLF